MGPTGFEPATPWSLLRALRASPTYVSSALTRLSYGPVNKINKIQFKSLLLY